MTDSLRTILAPGRLAGARTARAAAVVAMTCTAPIGCAPSEPAADEPVATEPAMAADLGPRVTLIGTPLREPEWSPEVRARLEEDLAIAQAAMNVAPDREDSYENFTYYDAVRFFKGTRTREELEPEADSLIRYAFAMDHHFNGEQAEAEAIWCDLVVSTPQGYWPAEAELVMARGDRRRE